MSAAKIHTPPTRPTITHLSIILFGAIDPPSFPTDWRSNLSTSLSHLPIDILNPHRTDWDSSWVEDPSFAPFREQVEWEMDYGLQADVIVFYFKPGALTPIALLELGVYAGRVPEKVVVCCPEGFYKRGNVRIVCERFGVLVVEGLEELEGKVRERVEGLLLLGEREG